MKAIQQAPFFGKTGEIKPGDVVFEMLLPMPCSCNSMHQPYGGSISLTSEARSYYWQMKLLIEQTWKKDGRPAHEGRLAAYVILHEPDLRRRDINNYTKTLFDALQRAGVLADDKQIDETHLYRGDVVKGGGVYVKLTALKELSGIARLPLKEQEKLSLEADKNKQRAMLLARRCGKEALETLKVFEVDKPKKPRR